MADQTGSGRVVIVTGASSGIGEAAARRFSERGDAVVLSARRADRLEALRNDLEKRGGRALVVPLDLADPSQAPALVERTREAFGRIDVLVNNAGFGRQNRFETQDDAEIVRMFAVNVLAPLALAKAVIPIMRAQGDGSILNVASEAGVVGHPLNAVYCATKHALVGFSRSLRLELKGTGVRVTAVCPGATATEFFDRGRGDVPYGKLVTAWQDSPDKVARVLVRASRRNRPIVFTSFSARLIAWADKWFRPLADWGNVAYRDAALKQGEAASTRPGGP